MQEEQQVVNKEDGSWERKMLQEIIGFYQKERRSARRWAWVRRTLWFALLVVVVLSAFGTMGGAGADYRTQLPHTAVIELKGEIAADNPNNARSLIEALNRAFAAEQSQSIILLVNSPGGSPVQSGMIADTITALRQKYPQKKIYTVAEDLCASGAYYVAAATDEIYVNQASLVGSIGVFMGGFGFSQLMEDLGVERRLVTAGENKAMLDPFSPAKPEHQAYQQNLVNQIHTQFINAVKAGRGARLKEDPTIFSGLVWTGENSVTLGLADGLASLEQLNALKGNYPLVDYTPQESIENALIRRLSTSVESQLLQKGIANIYTLR